MRISEDLRLNIEDFGLNILFRTLDGLLFQFVYFACFVWMSFLLAGFYLFVLAT